MCVGICRSDGGCMLEERGTVFHFYSSNLTKKYYRTLLAEFPYVGNHWNHRFTDFRLEKTHTIIKSNHYTECKFYPKGVQEILSLSLSENQFYFLWWSIQLGHTLSSNLLPTRKVGFYHQSPQTFVITPVKVGRGWLEKKKITTSSLFCYKQEKYPKSLAESAGRQAKEVATSHGQVVPVMESLTVCPWTFVTSCFLHSSGALSFTERPVCLPWVSGAWGMVCLH